MCITVFGLIAEEGLLENQALLLAESIRKFAGIYSSSRIVVISPRSSRRPTQGTIKLLEKLGVEIVFLDIQSVAPEYGTSFRVHAAAILEAQCSEERLVFLDSDIVFCGEPSLELGEANAAARPVDVKGMCTTGVDDANDAYWQNLCKISSVEYDDLPYTTTTVDSLQVKASYNGGFIVVHPAAAIFRRTEEFFVKSVRSNIRPFAGRGLTIQTGHGLVTGVGAEYWGSSQACLSLAIWGNGLTLKELTRSHNLPIHIESYLSGDRISQIDPIAIHYHHVFHLDNARQSAARLNLSREVSSWLQEKLPI